VSARTCRFGPCLAYWESLVTHYLVCYVLVPKSPTEYRQSKFGNEVIVEHPFDWLAVRRRHCSNDDTLVLVSWQTLTDADVEALKRSSAMTARAPHWESGLPRKVAR
jgi:hypothetical protein